jgi:excisionase family DNA binding protein
MTQVTTAVAAERLGVSQRQVQRLIEAGELPATRTAGDAWVVDALTVNAMARTRPTRGRPWSPATAWAALWRVSRLEVDWLDRRTTRRLDDRLASIDAEELVHATRRRAVIHRYRASESFLPDIDALVIHTGARAMEPSRFGMERDLGRLDGYCTSEVATRLARDFHLVEDPRGNTTLRVAAVPSAILESRNVVPVAVIAADLAESLEVRERSAGLRVLGDLLR